MKKIVTSLVLSFIVSCLWAQPVYNEYEYDLNYFIPYTHQYDNKIPQPKEILGFEIGEQFVDWNDVQKYIYALDASSDRVSVSVLGKKSYENRNFLQVIITSEDNQKKLQQIKEEHLKLTDAKISSSLDVSKMHLRQKPHFRELSLLEQQKAASLTHPKKKKFWHLLA